MIFLSHTYKDKPVVEQVALSLAKAIPREQLFYDSWSIQPGDGIIDKMNAGLEDCKLFLFFVSKNSLQSSMVKLEWQNALLKATKGQTKIVPVKLDDCLMPPILAQTLYVDLFGQGLEVATRQIVDVIAGRNTFAPGPQSFHNLRAYGFRLADGLQIECRAEYYMEPISHFVLHIDNAADDLQFELPGNPTFISGYNGNRTLSDGTTGNFQLLSIGRATTPTHPFLIKIRPREGKEARVLGVLHERAYNEWAPIPYAMVG